MVVKEKVGDVAIVTDGGGGYLVVDILGKAATYKEASELLEDIEEEQESGDEDEGDDNDDEEGDE